MDNRTSSASREPGAGRAGGPQPAAAGAPGTARPTLLGSPPAPGLLQPATGNSPTSAALRSLDLTILVTATLCLIALAVMLVFHLRGRASDPYRSPRLAALKLQLLDQPKDEGLKQQIRELDLVLRRRYAQHMAVNRFGAWFLLASAVLLVVGAKLSARLRDKLPAPQTTTDAAERADALARQGRRTATIAGVLTLAAFLFIGWPANTRLPAHPSDVDRFLARLHGESAAAPAALPSSAEFAANWPRFLGPTANAFASNATLPLAFDLSSGAGVLWKTPVPVPGFNSPIIWTNRVFLSGGDATNRGVLCFDLSSGAQVWQRAVANVPGSPPTPPEIPESTGFAAATMATDGLRVYAIFANGDLAAFTLDGRPVWSRNLGVPENPYGHAASLATFEGNVIVQLDQGNEEDNKSKLIALDGATGKVIWQTPRPVGASWASPVVAEAAGKPQVVALGGELIMAYHARDGAELWRARLLGGEVTPSPVFTAGLFLVASPSDTLYAIRPDGTGDIAKTHVLWKTDENIPDVTSPVSNGELVFTVLSHGVVTCHDFKDGQKLWEQEADTEVHATPSIAGDRLCILGGKGRVLVMAAAREAKELAKFELGEDVFASPAFAHGRMVVRTAKTLFAVSVATPPGPSHEPPTGRAGGPSPAAPGAPGTARPSWEGDVGAPEHGGEGKGATLEAKQP